MTNAAAPAAKKKPKPGATPAFSAAESLKEAERIIGEGLHLRLASLQRRFALQGPLNFIDPPKSVAPPKTVQELTPKYLRRAPEGWQVTDEGFVLAIERADGLAIHRAINAQREDLGVYSCEKTASGYRMVVEF